MGNREHPISGERYSVHWVPVEERGSGRMDRLFKYGRAIQDGPSPLIKMKV